MKWSDPSISRESRLPSGVTSMAKGLGHMILELMFWVVGIAMILTYFLATAGLETQRKQGIDQFTQAQAQATESVRLTHSARLEDLSLPGQTMLSQTLSFPNERAVEPAPDPAVDANANADIDSLPVAVLRIASLELEVPVYPDVTELNLSRGAGWIGGTAAPNAGGNMAIAAHRDQYFRPLKDIQVGDIMELESHTDRGEYRVSRITIVDPDNVSVLEDTKESTLTLVTCYPFYFIGNAPQRYIVQAVAVDQPGNVSAPGTIPTAISSGETP